MRLTIDLLEKTFIFVWQSGSFYRASRLSGLSVNCLKYRINLFETWLGKDLYIKKRYDREMTLTQFGYDLMCCLGNRKIYPSALVKQYERN